MVAVRRNCRIFFPSLRRYRLVGTISFLEPNNTTDITPSHVSIGPPVFFQWVFFFFRNSSPFLLASLFSGFYTRTKTNNRTRCSRPLAFRLFFCRDIRRFISLFYLSLYRYCWRDVPFHPSGSGDGGSLVVCKVCIVDKWVGFV